MFIRTDLALEIRELAGSGKIDGVIEESYSKSGAKVSKIEIVNDNGAKKLGKAKGTYITAEFGRLYPSFDEEEQIKILSDELSSLLPDGGCVLVAGLGNTNITPDALGPKTAHGVLATRHIKGESAERAGLGGLRETAVIAPGVLGQTGVETSEIIKGICGTLSPAAVIAVDAMASRRLSRLGSTVQMCNTGIFPGSGVGNARAELSYETLGVPVIALGVPTVVEASTLAGDIAAENGYKLSFSDEKGMIVTPREIDLVINRASKMLSLAINVALNPRFSVEEFSAFMG